MNIQAFSEAQAQSPQVMFPQMLAWTKMVFNEVKLEDVTARKFMTDWFIKSRIFMVPPPDHVLPDNGLPIDMPFDYCYFEYPNKNFGVTDEQGRKINVCFIIAADTKAFTTAFAYGYFEGELPQFFSYLEEAGVMVPRFSHNLWLMDLIRTICSSVKSGVIATERVNIKQKVRLNGQNTHHRIKEIIHIVDRKNAPIARVSTGSIIDWTHRWEVRGHWRKHDGLGKDRHGHYCVSGFTWVSEHERGPENKPLVKKIRTISETESSSKESAK